MSQGQGLHEPFSEHRQGVVLEGGVVQQGIRGGECSPDPEKQGPRARNLSRQVHLSASWKPQIKGESKLS